MTVKKRIDKDKWHIPRVVVHHHTEDFEVEVRYEADYKTEIEDKVVNRVINLHYPDGTKKTVTQTVKLTREVKTNLQTGEKQYGDWTTGQFEEFVVPTLDGHVSDVDKIGSMEVDGNTKDQKLDVNYAAYKVDTETKTVNRVITITMPDGSKKTVNQVVTFVKEVTRNPFDGSTIKETDWKVDGNAS